jgi:hypothetical protein
VDTDWATARPPCVDACPVDCIHPKKNTKYDDASPGGMPYECGNCNLPPQEDNLGDLHKAGLFEADKRINCQSESLMQKWF